MFISVINRITLRGKIYVVKGSLGVLEIISYLEILEF